MLGMVSAKERHDSVSNSIFCSSTITRHCLQHYKTNNIHQTDQKAKSVSNSSEICSSVTDPDIFIFVVSISNDFKQLNLDTEGVSEIDNILYMHKLLKGHTLQVTGYNLHLLNQWTITQAIWI